MNHTINQIRQAGFTFELENVENRNMMDGLLVEPFSKLTAPQLQFLKANKYNIIAALKREQGIKERTLDDDRRYCHECQYLTKERCNIQRFSPLDEHPKRCKDFLVQREQALKAKQTSEHLNQLRQTGFSLTLIGRGLFKVEPINQLTDTQQQFLTEHADAISVILFNEIK
jgi:hypothetical protein